MAVSFIPSQAGAKQKTVKKKVSVTVFEGGKKTLRCAQLNNAKKVKLSNKDKNCASVKFNKKKSQVTVKGLNEGSTKAYLTVTRKNGKKFKFTYTVKVRSFNSADESDASSDSEKKNKKNSNKGKKNNKKNTAGDSTEAPADQTTGQAKYHYQIKLVNNSKYHLCNFENHFFYIQTDNPDPKTIVLCSTDENLPIIFGAKQNFDFHPSDVNYTDVNLCKVDGGYLLCYLDDTPLVDGSITFKLCEYYGKTKSVKRGVLSVIEPDCVDTGIRISIKAQDLDEQYKEFIKGVFNRAKEELNITAEDSELTAQQREDIIQNCADFIRYNTMYPTNYTCDLANYTNNKDMTKFYTIGDCLTASRYIEGIVKYLGGYAFWDNFHTTTYWFNDTVNTDTAFDWDKAISTYLELNEDSPEYIEAKNEGKIRVAWACPDSAQFDLSDDQIPKINPADIPNHPDCTVTYPEGY